MAEGQAKETITVKLTKENSLYHVKINGFSAGSFNDLEKATTYYESILHLVNQSVNNLMGNL